MVMVMIMMMMMMMTKAMPVEQKLIHFTKKQEINKNEMFTCAIV